MISVFLIILKLSLFHSLTVRFLVFGIFRRLRITAEARNIKYAFTINRYDAPASILQLAVARE